MFEGMSKAEIEKHVLTHLFLFWDWLKSSQQLQWAKGLPFKQRGQHLCEHEGASKFNMIPLHSSRIMKCELTSTERCWFRDALIKMERRDLVKRQKIDTSRYNMVEMLPLGIASASELAELLQPTPS